MSRRKQAKPQHINSEEQPPDAASGKGRGRARSRGGFQLSRGAEVARGSLLGGGLFPPLCFTPRSFPPPPPEAQIFGGGI